MTLATTFQIDPHAPWVAAHNSEVREVWAAFQTDKPLRVPVQYTGARARYLEANHLDWSRYYDDPDEMMRIQLESARYYREIPWGDHPLATMPEQWDIAVDFHPVATAASFGCPVLFRPDAVPAHECLHLSKDACLAMAMPDVLSSGLLPRHAAFEAHLDQWCAGAPRFLGQPVRRHKPTLPSAGGGIFSLALDLRGPEIMSDMYEDPDFVHAFLERLAEWRIALSRAWTARDGLAHAYDEPGKGQLDITDHGIDMLSTEIYDTFLGALNEKLRRKYALQPAVTLHHCGRGAHLFPLMRERYGFTTLHALTWPLNDVGRIRRELGYEIRIIAVIADSILQQGADATHEAVRQFLTPEVKGPGRLSIWIPGEVSGIPVDSYHALYDAVKAYGRYD